MSLGNRKPCEYCWLGPLCKRCSFDLYRDGGPISPTDVFFYRKDFVVDDEENTLSFEGMPPIDKEEIYELLFDETYLTMTFNTCRDAYAFTKIFPAGSQAIFYYNVGQSIFISEAYEYTQEANSAELKLPISQFQRYENSTLPYETINDLLKNVVNNFTTNTLFSLRFCTTGEQFTDA